VVPLLMHSQTFCHVGLERQISRWRAGLAAALNRIAVSEQSELPSTWLFCDAAAVACHLLFVRYCIPYYVRTSEDCALNASRMICAGTYPCGDVGIAAWLLLSLYEMPAEVPLPPSLSQLCAGMPADNPIATLVSRCVHEPREEAMFIADKGSAVASLPDTPCRAFYDATVYPPWHGAVESAGVVPLPIHKRLRQLFPWRQHIDHDNSGRHPSRVLIAGCGSGHQIAVELRVYADCTFVALDCSPSTVAHARRKLRAVLNDEEFARVSFVVGDILDLSPDDSVVGVGFDLVVCCGVLHHLKDPVEGLRRLTATLAPGGVLQLATYSRLSVDTWREDALKFLRRASTSQHLYNASGELMREPTHAELREIRSEVLSLPQENELRRALVHFREFFTRAGLLDLLFHPLETRFTLLELRDGPLQAANLGVVGVFFPDVNTDFGARKKFKEMHGDADERMLDLALWHALEKADPEIFGRMHTLFLERGEGSDVQRPISVSVDDVAQLGSITLQSKKQRA